MSDATKNTLILDELTIGDPISQRHGVKCCPAIRESTDERYIVKILSIPASSVQLDALLLTGAYSSPDHALEYFRGRAEDVLREVGILDRLHAMEGFLPFTHAEIRKSEDGSGYQVYLVSPYKRSLERQMQLNPLTHLGAVNLGLDLCAALAICRRAGYLYMDLKPSNVYVIPNQGYRISDLGFVSLDSLKYASYPEQYRSPYTAPEISDSMSTLNGRIDIYALGLILYQVYNNGELPAQTEGPMIPPAYADYEMAAIILKACDPNPTRRWTDPLQMGQAIVSYLQRNNVNDTPIVPPPVEVPPEPEAEDPVLAEAENIVETDAILDSILEEIPPLESVETEEPQAEAQEAAESQLEDAAQEPASEEDLILDLEFIDDGSEDETVPTEESAAEITDELVTEEVQEMLARADELISHELPEPAVAPDPIDVPFPAPIVLAEEEEPVAEPAEETDSDADDLAEETEDAESEIEDPIEDEEQLEEAEASEEDQPGAEEAEDWNADISEPSVPEYYTDGQAMKSKRSRRRKKVAIIFISVALLAALIAGGFLFYHCYYLQNVESLTINGSVDSLTATIESSINNDLLTVVCTDTYGNTHIQKVVNGRAHFTNLTPNTQYRVELKIDGFHQLKGVTSGSFTTAAQTEILNFNAMPGAEDGSVKLSFSVNGPDAEEWAVAYSTGDGPEVTQPFTGHAVTIEDLMIGSEYQFRLVPQEDQHLAGTWMLRYTAQKIIFAQDLVIRSCGDGTLVAVWNVPEGMADPSWIVRCYNDNGFVETITTTEAQAQFTNLDHAYGYTVEVTAAGMPKSVTTTVSANPITLTGLTAKEEAGNILSLNWTYTGEAPAEGWVLDYTLDGGNAITLSCPENTAKIPCYPGSQYEITVHPVGEATYFGTSLSYQAEKADMFSKYNANAKDMDFKMCLTPDKKNWDRHDLDDSDYKETFKIGEKASFLIKLPKKVKKSDDKITVTYIIRDENGLPVSLNSIESTWNKLWNKKYCELDIPQMPETAGKYTIDIYFNGRQINKDALNFTIK